MSYESAVRQLSKEAGDLVARHEKLRGLQDFTKYADDPEGFMRDVLRCEPWSKQVEMAERIRDNRRVCAVTCNAVGKDWVSARIALWWVYARRGLVILSGPTLRQVREILMREVRSAFSRSPELPGELYSLELRVDNDSGILAFTSDNASKLTGFHHPRLLVFLTEAQGCDEEAYEASMACCTAPENRLFVYGNPTQPAGPFYRAATSSDWSVLKIAASEHPNVVTGRAEIPGSVSVEWIAMMRDEYGEASSIYRARVLAEFPEESIEGLVKREWIRAAFQRHEEGVLRELSWARPLHLSLDVARYGPDASVLAVVRGPVVESLFSWRGASITETADKVIEHADRLRRHPRHARATIICDEPGLGGGCIDVLRQKGLNVVAFNGASSAPSPDGARFLNLRAASYWKFRELLENGKIALPRDAELEEEALATEWQLTPAGCIQIVSKDLIRKTLGRSPDRLDSVVMGLYESMGWGRQQWGSGRWSFGGAVA